MIVCAPRGPCHTPRGARPLDEQQRRPGRWVAGDAGSVALSWRLAKCLLPGGAPRAAARRRTSSAAANASLTSLAAPRPLSSRRSQAAASMSGRKGASTSCCTWLDLVACRCSRDATSAGDAVHGAPGASPAAVAAERAQGPAAWYRGRAAEQWAQRRQGTAGARREREPQPAQQGWRAAQAQAG